MPHNASFSSGHDDPLSRWSARVPYLVVGYMVALATLRLSLSPFLEVDEAQFVGHVDFRLVYENSHPPLYNWLLRLLLEASGWNWAFSTATLKYALLGGFHLLTWDAARRLGGPRAGLLAVAASAFLPQIVWMSAHTLAHSIMVMAGVAAVVHASVLIVTARSEAGLIWRYVWLGAALALGALAKYNFLLFAAPFLACLLWAPSLRPLFLRREAGLSALIFVVLTAPTAIAAALNLGASAERLDKLYKSGSGGSAFDLPYLGVDGLISALVAALAWAGPAVFAWGLALYLDRRSGEPAAPSPQAFLVALGRAIAIALILLALIVLAADMHRVHERYLTPLLAALPVWLAAARPLSRSGPIVAVVSVLAYLGALAGVWGMVAYGKHRYAVDYDLVAVEARRITPDPIPIQARRHDDAANLILALGWTGAQEPNFAEVEDRVLLVWRGRGEARLDELAEEGFRPAGRRATIVAPFKNRSGRTIAYSLQLLVRSPSGS